MHIDDAQSHGPRSRLNNGRVSKNPAMSLRWRLRRTATSLFSPSPWTEKRCCLSQFGSGLPASPGRPEDSFARIEGDAATGSATKHCPEQGHKVRLKYIVRGRLCHADGRFPLLIRIIRIPLRRQSFTQLARAARPSHCRCRSRKPVQASARRRTACRPIRGLSSTTKRSCGKTAEPCQRSALDVSGSSTFDHRYHARSY